LIEGWSQGEGSRFVEGGDKARQAFGNVRKKEGEAKTVNWNLKKTLKALFWGGKHKGGEKKRQ